MLQDQVPEEAGQADRDQVATFGEVLVALKRWYPSYETELSIRTEIHNLAVLPNDPKAARISELLADLDHWLG